MFQLVGRYAVQTVRYHCRRRRLHCFESMQRLIYPSRFYRNYSLINRLVVDCANFSSVYRNRPDSSLLRENESETITMKSV